ncbi:MAG: hypothetical protein KKB79_03530, partial [Nanoarchaeota archaeon]|nr:hypothetical protein [Nanoarchaeota archaeon]
GEENKAKKEIESAINMLKIVQSKTTPEIAEEVKSNIAETGSKINENLNLEFFEKYLTEEQKTKLIIEHSEKILEYCEELAKQDYNLMLKDEKCQNNAPDWLEDEVNNRIEEVQKQDSEEMKKQIEITMNNPKNSDCDGISLTSERTKCEKFKALAVRCEFQNDESACKEIGMFKDVRTNKRENYEQEILNKYVPAECTEAGIRDGEECKKFIITLYKPDSECMENGQVLDGEACGKKLVNEDKIPQECIKNGEPVSPEECENIMKEKSKPSGEEFKLMSGECKERGVYDLEACDEIVNLPRPCKDAGYYTKEECESFTLNQNLPKECIEAGALTPEACEKIKLPEKCQGQAFSNEECEAVFIKEKMPAECQESGTYNFHKCAKLLYAEVSDISIEGESEYLASKGISFDEIPNECLNGMNFVRGMDCDEALIKKFGIMLPPPVETSTIPQECMRSGTPVSPEECEEILGNGIMQNELQDAIPKICQDANVETPEECGKLLEKQRKEQGIGINMPEECIGLDVEECKEIMGEKNITIKKPEVEERAICCKKIINGKPQYHWDSKEVCVDPASIEGQVVDDDSCLALGLAIDNEDEIIKEGVPEECAKLSVYDKESCDMIMSKINAERIKNGDKIIIDDDGATDIITKDQINQIADDADKKSDDIKPDTTKADQIKQQVDDIEDDIKKIDKIGGDMQEPDGNERDLDVVDNGGASSGGNGDNGDDVVGGGSGGGGDNNLGSGNNVVAGDGSGGDSGGIESSGGESSGITGAVIGSGNKESFLGKILKGIFGI